MGAVICLFHVALAVEDQSPCHPGYSVSERSKEEAVRLKVRVKADLVRRRESEIVSNNTQNFSANMNIFNARANDIDMVE